MNQSSHHTWLSSGTVRNPEHLQMRYVLPLLHPTLHANITLKNNEDFFALTHNPKRQL